MTGLICNVCGGLLHVGLGHICPVRMDQAELDRRVRRAQRAEQRMADPWFAPFVGVSYGPLCPTCGEQLQPGAHECRDLTPIRVQAYVGHRLAEIETRGRELIDGELA